MRVPAICNKCSDDVAGCRLYVLSFPGSDDAKVIIQSRIQEVIVLQAEDFTVSENASDDEQASRILLDMANVQVRYCKPSNSSITLDFVAKLSSSPAAESRTAELRHYANLTSPGDSRVRQLLLQEANYDVSSIQDNGKRKDCISWQDYFMAMAFLTAQRSKDPNTQVGWVPKAPLCGRKGQCWYDVQRIASRLRHSACIVDSEKRIVGLGYNGFPRGCSDDHLPWARGNKNPLENKYLFVCHAEVNGKTMKIVTFIQRMNTNSLLDHESYSQQRECECKRKHTLCCSISLWKLRQDDNPIRDQRSRVHEWLLSRYRWCQSEQNYVAERKCNPEAVLSVNATTSSWFQHENWKI